MNDIANPPIGGSNEQFVPSFRLFSELCHTRSMHSCLRSIARSEKSNYNSLMIKGIVASLVLIGLLGQSSPKASEELKKCRQQARAAHEADDKQARIEATLKVRQLLNDSPSALEGSAHAFADAGDVHRTIATLTEFADAGQVDDNLLNGSDQSFAKFHDLPEYQTILEHIRKNKGPVSQANLVFTLTDPRIVAEDIAFDKTSKTFLITSILEKKILRVTMKGKASAFADSPSHWPMFAIKVDAKRELVWATEAALKDFTPAPKADWDRSAVLCFDLRTGALLHRIEGPPHSALADLSLAQNGDPIVSDGFGGGVYRLVAGKLVLLNETDFISPQTADILPDGQHALVPDYLRGVGILDLDTGQVAWMNPVGGLGWRAMALSGIDGLYFDRDSIILTQNGTSPERVVRLRLDATYKRIFKFEAIEKGTATLGDPTHGVIVGRSFYYIANSGWSELDEHGEVKPESKLTGAHIMRFKLN